jgi:tripartite-type tricarboxylate transporter receptor subunit TctC
MMQRREILASSLGMAMLSAVGLAQAQSTKTVRIVVPFASSGVQDTLARALSQEMGAALGQTVIVENRPGAGGTVGTGYVARAEADGTVMVAAAASHNIAGSLYTKLAYDPQKDFTPLAHIGSASYVLMVNPDVPAKTAAEFIRYAINEVLSGRAQAVIAASIGALAFAKDSRVRLLGVTSPQRSKYLPDLPTIAESGLPGYQFDSWFGFLGPAAIPAAEANRINAAVSKLLKDPVVLARLDKQGIEPRDMSNADFSKLLAADFVRMAQVVKASGAKID